MEAPEIVRRRRAGGAHPGRQQRLERDNRQAARGAKHADGAHPSAAHAIDRDVAQIGRDHGEFEFFLERAVQRRGQLGGLSGHAALRLRRRQEFDGQHGAHDLQGHGRIGPVQAADPLFGAAAHDQERGRVGERRGEDGDGAAEHDDANAAALRARHQDVGAAEPELV